MARVIAFRSQVIELEVADDFMDLEPDQRQDVTEAMMSTGNFKRVSGSYEFGYANMDVIMKAAEYPTNTVGPVTATRLEVTTDDGPKHPAFEDVPWRHWHTWERNRGVPDSALKGHMRGLVTRSKPEAADWVAQPVAEGRLRRMEPCVNRDCGGAPPPGHIEQIEDELEAGGPAHMDPFYDEQIVLGLLAARQNKAHVAEHTIADGTILMPN